MATHTSSEHRIQGRIPGRVRAAFHRVDPGDAAHRSRPPLDRGERVLVSERAEGSAPVVATTRALHHRGPVGWLRLPWEEIGRVRWDAAKHTLELIRFTGGSPAMVTVRLNPPTRLPSVVKERVTATILVSTRVELDGWGYANVVARCRPGTSDVVWIVQLAAGSDPDDGAVQVRVDQAIHDLRRHLGL